jgi:hypothetical protein
MQDSVESLILSLDNAGNLIFLVWDQIPAPVVYAPHRRRSRVRRILHRLRAIRRTHPRLISVQRRDKERISVECMSPQSLTMFALLWPQDFPPYRVTDHDPIPVQP